ncbi:MAG: hypothetical protein RL186_1391 [Pseudomonadota bacterium]|jgi:exonuclease III
MRILTWNCNGAFRRKVNLLEPFGADIIVVQECEEPSQGYAEYHRWAGQHIWAGSNLQKGLAVFVREGHTVTPLAWPDAGTSLFLPVTVNECLQVLGVWTQVAPRTQDSYTGQFWHYFQRNRAKVSHNMII